MNKNLQPTATKNPDQFPNFRIKDCSEVFIKPTTTILNLTLKTSTFPEEWKLTRVRLTV